MGCGGVANGMYGRYVTAAPATPPAENSPKKVRVPPRPGALLDNRATILVNLPADARLTFGGHLTTLTSTTRYSQDAAAPLQAGLKYQCVLRAEIVRDGVPSVVERTVLVRANEEFARFGLGFANAGLRSALILEGFQGGDVASAARGSPMRSSFADR